MALIPSQFTNKLWTRTRSTQYSVAQEYSPELLHAYDTIIKEQIESEIVEPAPNQKRENVHYMPHHAVLTPEKSTQLRIVYNASAKQQRNTSLNDNLYKGRNLLVALMSILLRFRTHSIAVVSDLEKAYHQIELQEEDRDYLRFLWLNDPNKPPTIDNLIELRF